jgi:hypothetical protein
MNLNDLNSNLPKPWLNPNVNTLTCNTLTSNALSINSFTSNTITCNTLNATTINCDSTTALQLQTNILFTTGNIQTTNALTSITLTAAETVNGVVGIVSNASATAIIINLPTSADLQSYVGLPALNVSFDCKISITTIATLATTFNAGAGTQTYTNQSFFKKAAQVGQVLLTYSLTGTGWKIFY